MNIIVLLCWHGSSMKNSSYSNARTALVAMYKIDCFLWTAIHIRPLSCWHPLTVETRPVTCWLPLTAGTRPVACWLLLTIIINIIIIIKKTWQCKAGRERLTSYQSEDPNPTTPTHRMKEDKEKTAGDRNELVARPIKSLWPCSWNAPVPHHRTRGH